MASAGVLVFESTSAALKAEHALKQAGVPCSVIPTPLDVSSECGIALLLSGRWIEPAVEALEEAGALGHRLIIKYKGKGGEE